MIVRRFLKLFFTHRLVYQKVSICGGNHISLRSAFILTIKILVDKGISSLYRSSHLRRSKRIQTMRKMVPKSKG